MEKIKPWYGFDFDGTLAEHYPGQEALGPPISPMVKKAKQLLSKGQEVRIVTARPAQDWKDIGDWTEKHLGKRLKVQSHKSPAMKILYDDRVRQVRKNKGTLV